MRSFLFMLLNAMILSAPVSAATFGGLVEPSGSPGLVDAVGCTTAACEPDHIRFEWNGLHTSATGQLQLDDSSSVLSLNITLGAAATLNAIDGEDNGVAEVSLTDLSLSAPSLEVERVSQATEKKQWELSAGQTVSEATGTQTQRNNQGDLVNDTPSLFSTGPIEVSGGCEQGAGKEELRCNLVLGPSGFVLGIGDPDGGFEPQDRYFSTTLDVATVPEPGTGGLLAAGLLVVTAARRQSAGI